MYKSLCLPLSSKALLASLDANHRELVAERERRQRLSNQREQLQRIREQILRIRDIEIFPVVLRGLPILITQLLYSYQPF
jgi:hypothetical protein